MFDLMLSAVLALAGLHVALGVLRAPVMHGGLLNMERYNTPEDDPFAGLVISGRAPLLLRVLHRALGLDPTAELRADDSHVSLRYPTLRGTRTSLLPHSAVSHVQVCEHHILGFAVLGSLFLAAAAWTLLVWWRVSPNAYGIGDTLYYGAFVELLVAAAFFVAYRCVRPLRLSVAVGGDHHHGMTLLPSYIEGMWVGRESLDDFAHQLRQRVERARRVREDVQPGTVAMRRPC